MRALHENQKKIKNISYYVLHPRLSFIKHFMISLIREKSVNKIKTL